MNRWALGLATKAWTFGAPEWVHDVMREVGVRMGYGGGFGGYWYCTGCGNPQLGDPPWREVGVRDRCLPCGPGRGWVRCPATHGKTGCNLCRGRGWVEEI